MKRRWIITLTLIPAIVVVVALVAYCHHTVPSSQCSALYRHYENNPHLYVTYIKDFPIDDTLTVDVTTIRATDDEGWNTLTADFNIPVLPDIVLSTMAGKEDFILTFKASEDYREMYEQVGICRSDVIALSYIKHIVSIFRTESDSEQKAVLEYNLNQSLKKKQQ